MTVTHHPIRPISRRGDTTPMNLLETLEKATGRETYYPLAALVIDQNLQWRRRGLNADRVSAYIQDIEGWLANDQPIAFPPLEVWEIEGVPHVVSGFHRYAALKEMGVAEFPCIVKQGTWIEAKRASALSNLQHGLEYDELSKKAIMAFMMQPGMEWEFLSNGAIASLLRIGSQTTVAMWIDQLSNTGELKSDRSRVLGRDGKWRDVSQQKAKFTPEQITRKREQYKLRQAVKSGWLDEVEAKSGEWTEASDKPNDSRVMHKSTGEIIGGVRSDGGVLEKPNQPVFEKPSREVIESLQGPSVGVAMRQVDFSEMVKAMDFSGKKALSIVESFHSKWSDNEVVLFLNLMGSALADLYGAWLDMASDCQLKVNNWTVEIPE